MNKKQTIKKCIEIAVENGWQEDYDDGSIIVAKTSKTDTAIEIYNDCCTEFEALLFNHDFAKALFGEDETWYDPNRDDVEVTNEGWKFHLQQLATAENRIDYLKDYLSNNKT